MPDMPLLDNHRIIHYHRSGLVTMVAYVMIVLSAFSLVSTLIQLSVLHHTFDPDNLQRMLDKQSIHYPWLNTGRLQTVFFTLVFGGLALDIVKLIAAIALNHRKNWARLFYLVYFLIAGIAWFISATILSVAIYFGKGLSEQQSFIETASRLILIVTLLIGLQAIFYLFGLFVLASHKVREEFS